MATLLVRSAPLRRPLGDVALAAASRARQILPRTTTTTTSTTMMATAGRRSYANGATGRVVAVVAGELKTRSAATARRSFGTTGGRATAYGGGGATSRLGRRSRTTMARTRATGGRLLRPRQQPSDAPRPPAPGRTASGSAGRRKSTAIPTGATGATSPLPRRGSFRDLFLALREGLHEIILRPRTVSVPRWITPKRFTVTYSECFGHASFILVAASYATDDFLTLRCVAVVGSASMLLFTYFHPHGRVLWLPLKWNLLFIAINSYRIGWVLFQSYRADFLSDEMKRIRSEHFFVIDPIDFAKLVRIGKLETYEPGDLVVQQNDMNRYIRLIVSGEVEALRDGQLTYYLGEANFMSEGGLHAGLLLTGNVQSCCSIVARRRDSDGRKAGPVRILRWDRTELMELLEREPQLRRSIKAALSWDIVRKLKGQRHMLTSGDVDDPERWTLKRNEQNEDRYAAILFNLLRHPDYLSDHRDELNKYRIIHHIDDEHHKMALEKCGWTLEEFNLGRRLRHAEDDDEEEEEEKDHVHDWRVRIHSLVARVLR